MILAMLRDHLPPIDTYLADAMSLEDQEFLLRYPWPWLVVPEPTPDILSRIRRPETVVAQAHHETMELKTNDPKMLGASLDALCLELRPISDPTGRRPVMTLGRSSDADVVLLHESISRYHAELTYDRNSGRSHLMDLGARNGTWLEGEPLSPRRGVPIASGSVVRMGALFMRFHAPDGFVAWLRDGAPRSGAAPAKWPES